VIDLSRNQRSVCSGIGDRFGAEYARYGLAIGLLEFALKYFKKFYSEEYRYMNVINLAQSYKWSGQNEKLLNILDQTDWSTFDYKFKLANEVLRDNFPVAIGYMYKIGDEGDESEVKSSYKEWPLFREFRKDAGFRKAFRDIFNEDIDGGLLVQLEEGLEEETRENNSFRKGRAARYIA
jgi:hypothetical protein